MGAVKTHNGRPGYKVLPDDWGTRLSTAATQPMTALCEIRAPSTFSEPDPGTGVRTETQGAMLYTGKCRVQRLLQDRLADSGERAVQTLTHLVAIDRAANPTPAKSLVKITQVADTALQGQTLTVEDVVMGSLRVERDLFCTLT